MNISLFALLKGYTYERIWGSFPFVDNVFPGVLEQCSTIHGHELRLLLIANFNIGWLFNLIIYNTF